MTVTRPADDAVLLQAKNIYAWIKRYQSLTKNDDSVLRAFADHLAAFEQYVESGEMQKYRQSLKKT